MIRETSVNAFRFEIMLAGDKLNNWEMVKNFFVLCTCFAKVFVTHYFIMQSHAPYIFQGLLGGEKIHSGGEVLSCRAQYIIMASEIK